MKKKLVVIGVDGLSIDIARKHLPQTTAMFNAHGSISDVVTDLNDRGWPTLLTGADASWHGGYYWIFKPATYSVKGHFDADDYCCPTIYENLSRQGHKVGLLGVPTTYPPKEINGVIVSSASGGLVPDFSKIVEPRHIVDHNPKWFENLKVDCRYLQYKDEPLYRFVDDLSLGVNQKTKLTLKLIERYALDCFFLVHVGPDRLQHLYGDLLMAGASSGISWLPVLKRYYEALDAAIVDLCTVLKGEAVVAIVSDHGFAAFRREVYLNEILAENGFAVKKRSESRRKALNLAKKLLSSGFKNRLAKAAPTIVQRVISPLDMHLSKAFALSGNGVYVNIESYPTGVVKNEDYDSLRREIVQLLSEVRDPNLDQPVFRDIRLREEAYSGPAAASSPDIVFTLPEGYDIRMPTSQGPFFGDPPEPIYSYDCLPAIRSGIHGKYAIAAAIGADLSIARTLSDIPYLLFPAETLPITGQNI